MNNCLEVAGPALEERHLAAKSAEILAQSPYRELRQVVCTARGEKVILTGRVSSFYYKQQAQCHLQAQLASSVLLENRLEVLNNH